MRGLQPHAPLEVQHAWVSTPLQLGHMFRSQPAHLLLVHIWFDGQVIGQVSVAPQPSGFMPHSVLLHVAAVQAAQ